MMAAPLWFDAGRSARSSDASRRTSTRRPAPRRTGLRTLPRSRHALRRTATALPRLARWAALPRPGRGSLGRKVGEGVRTALHGCLHTGKRMLGHHSLGGQRTEHGNRHGPVLTRRAFGEPGENRLTHPRPERVRAGREVVAGRLDSSPAQCGLGSLEPGEASLCRSRDAIGRNALRLPLADLHLDEIGGNACPLRALDRRPDTLLGRSLARKGRRNRGHECDQRKDSEVLHQPPVHSCERPAFCPVDDRGTRGVTSPVRGQAAALPPDARAHASPASSER
jgi:hypothetical protein